MAQVSVVMSTYNRSDLLHAALRSALGQGGVDVEVVVVNNGSTDDTGDVLAGCTDERLRVITNEESLGGTGGRNTGLAAARGEWLTVHDDDDLWAPDKVAAQVGAATAAGVDWAYAGCVFIDQGGRVIGGVPPPPPDEVMTELPTRYVVPGGMSNTLWRRGVLDGDGLLDQRLSHTVDWDLSLRLARQGRPAMVRRPLVAYRQHGATLSRHAARLHAELDLIEEKFADLRGGRPLDRGAQQRFFGSQALRAGARREALVAYYRGVRKGDWGSLLRAVAVLAPWRLQPWLRRRFLSDPAWIAEARGWLEERTTSG